MHHLGTLRTLCIVGASHLNSGGYYKTLFIKRTSHVSLSRFISSKMSSSPAPPALCKQPLSPTSSHPPTANAQSQQGLATAAASVPVKTWEDQILKRYNDIGKSSEDKRSYRALELKNRMKVLLVSDPTTDKSAAAMDVNIGVMSDPDEVPGLAHFCEHMLFMGTEKYPGENEYNKFLSENSGHCNASTFVDHTCFYFDVVPEKLGDALDIFAQFFISPKFTSSATDRELNAVDLEHDKNLCNDGWRLDQLNRSTCNPEHPYSRFGSGNKETLETVPKQKGIDVRSELLKFHDKWYSSNIMALCVLGKESLDELEKIVAELFAGVEDKDVTAPRWDEHPCYPASQGTRITVVPVKDLRNLNITFPVPETKKFYKSGPNHYLSHLLGHEGPGSLLSVLKKRGWCNSLVGGTQSAARGFAFFGVQVDLTEDGINHVDDIVKLVFQYINLLKSLGPQKTVFDESRDILAMNYRFKDKEEPSNYVADHVHGLQEYPMEDVLTAHYHLTEWKPELIEDLLSLLTPERVRVGVVGKQFQDKCTSVEKWYGTKYHLERIPQEVIADWKNAGLCEELHLPEPNEFIPDSFELSAPDPESQEFPCIVKDTPFMRVWYKQDDEFFLPKLNTTIEFNSPLVYADPLSCNLTTIFSMLFRDALNEYAYAAELAGTIWHIGNSKTGISLRIEGYDSKQHVLLTKIMECMTEFKVDPKRFEVMKEMHARSYRNFKAEQPYQHGMYHLAVCLTEKVWTKKQLQDAAEAMTVEKLEDFIPRLLSTVHVECFIHGNATKARALQLAELVENKLPKSGIPLLPQHLMPDREVQLEKGSHYQYEVDHTVHKSSCIVLYYQCGMQSTESNVLLELLLQIVSEPFFDILRTKEQLGYIVFSGMRKSNGVQGLRVLVQSDRHPAYLETRVEAFLQHMRHHLETMSNEEFEKHRASLTAQRLKRPKQLYGRSGLFWSEIVSQQYHFNRTQVEVQALQLITREKLMEFFKEMVDVESRTRQKLGVHVISSAEGGAGHPDYKDQKSNVESNSTTDNNMDLLPVPELIIKAIKIEDLLSFKSGRSLYPHITPYTNVPRKGAHCKL